MQYYQECIALGSKTGISLVSAVDSDEIEALYRKLWHEVFVFERCFSRFLPGSELSIFNRQAGTKQYISPEFRDLLLASQALSRETDGLYNPFILPALQKSGYVASRVPGHEHDAVDNYSHKSVTKIEHLEIGTDWGRIPYGTALDLGGCGKGFLADQLRLLLPATITGYWLSFGGDIAVGGTNEQGKPWEITIEDANNPGKQIGSFTISTQAGIATSGTTVHHGKKDEKTWHHLIDPRTTQPAVTDVLLASVCDTSALRADVLASCAVILGSKKGMAFLRQRGVESAVLQCKTATNKTAIFHYGNGILLDTTHA